MSGMYAAVAEEVAVTAAQDLFQYVAPSDAVGVIHSIYITQSSDAGDSESEQLNVLYHRGGTNGSGGTTVTPAPLQLGASAAGGTVEANNTTQSTEGVLIHSSSFNVMAGYQDIRTPETRIYVSPSDIFNIELQTTPADSLTVTITVVFEEIGG